MKIRTHRTRLAVLAALAACLPVGSVVADDVDAGLAPLANRKALDTSLPKASPYSPTDRIEELEASRAAVDGKSKSPISLSVSGWVGYQVQVGK